MLQMNAFQDDFYKPLHIELDYADDDKIPIFDDSVPHSANNDAEIIFEFFAPTVSAKNAYTKFFKDILAFQTTDEARKSVQKIDSLFRFFAQMSDFAGQHQAMILALTGRNRARWEGKNEVAEIFDEWLKSH